MCPWTSKLLDWRDNWLPNSQITTNWNFLTVLDFTSPFCCFNLTYKVASKKTLQIFSKVLKCMGVRFCESKLDFIDYKGSSKTLECWNLSFVRSLLTCWNFHTFVANFVVFIALWTFLKVWKIDPVKNVENASKLCLSIESAISAFNFNKFSRLNSSIKQVCVFVSLWWFPANFVLINQRCINEALVLDNII